MGRRAATEYRRAGTIELPSAVPITRRWYGKLALILLAVVLLSLTFPPFGQFYLAWVGLVPWLFVLAHSRTPWRAFWWSWLAGGIFFLPNMGWIGSVTGAGLIALLFILGLYWAVAGLLIRWVVLTRPPSADGATPFRNLAAILGIATVWVTLEWLRGAWPFQGFPWLFLGHTQTPVLALCQIADTVGVAGVTFWVAMLNAWAALFILNRFRLRPLAPALVMVLAVTVAIVAYGVYRIGQTPNVTSPGPTVLVVQPNIPQDNSGAKGAPMEDIVAFHETTTHRALERDRSADLVAWSETVLPPINRGARVHFRGTPFGDFLELVHNNLMNLAREYGVGIIAGGAYWDDISRRGDRLVMGDTRNTAYYYERLGPPFEQHYDKIHRVPFGEYVPFKESIPWLYRLLVSFGPPNMEDYQLQAGADDALVIFPLTARGEELLPPRWRFVTPICFEDTDGPLVARMFRDTGSDGRPRKRADFIVNLTNDGWFRFNQMPQHLQGAVFRSIENRVPTARSVNTGISGFIDSDGRTHDLIPVGTEGTSTATLRLDPRLTLYTRWGDWFSHLCAAIVTFMALLAAGRWGIAAKVRGKKLETPNKSQ